MKASTWINLLIGIWLITFAFALPQAGSTDGRVVNDAVLGILLIVLSAWMLAAVAPPWGAAWLEILCGVWLIVAPFVLRYSTAGPAAWNDVACGIVAVVVAAIGARAPTRRPVA